MADTPRHNADLLQRRPLPLRAWLWTAVLPLTTGTMMAATISGTVLNVTQNRRAPGDEVMLYRVDRSMHETAHTHANAQGEFHFNHQSAGQFLVAVKHDSVSYHSTLVSVASPIKISVFDAVDMTHSAALIKMQKPDITVFPELDGQRLKVTEFLVYRNGSSPATTWLAKQRLRLPEGSVLDSTAAQPEGTLPFLLRPVVCGEVGKLCVSTPIRPGLTRLRVVYHMPLKGRLSVWQPFNQVAILVPEDLQLKPVTLATFSKESTPNGKTLYLSKSTAGSKPLEFSILTGDSSSVGALHVKYRRPLWLGCGDLPYTSVQAHRSAFPSLRMLISALLSLAISVAP